MDWTQVLTASGGGLLGAVASTAAIIWRSRQETRERERERDALLVRRADHDELRSLVSEVQAEIRNLRSLVDRASDRANSEAQSRRAFIGRDWESMLARVAKLEEAVVDQLRASAEDQRDLGQLIASLEAVHDMIRALRDRG